MKCRFTEFEGRCERCRFKSDHTDASLGARMGHCAITHSGMKPDPRPGGGFKVHTLYEVWAHYGRDWCPHYDEAPPAPPSLLRRLAKGLGLV